MSTNPQLLQIPTKNASELVFRPNNDPENELAVEKWNDGDCLKRVLAKFEGVVAESLGVNGHLKFGVRTLATLGY